MIRHGRDKLRTRPGPRPCVGTHGRILWKPPRSAQHRRHDHAAAVRPYAFRGVVGGCFVRYNGRALFGLDAGVVVEKRERVAGVHAGTLDAALAPNNIAARSRGSHAALRELPIVRRALQSAEDRGEHLGQCIPIPLS